MQFLQHHQINKQRYDECITTSVNSLIYARSFYLDEVCPPWSAIAHENYDWVMPVTWRKKWGIAYLYQPAFTQQLGVFFKAGIHVPHQEIIEALQKRFSFWEVNFNYLFPVQPAVENILTGECTNFILPLTAGYQSIYQGYKKDVVKNLKRCRQFELLYQKSNAYLHSIEAYITHYATRMPHVTKEDYNRFKNICAFAYKAGMLECRNVVHQQNGIVASVILLNDGNRLYNIMNTTTAAGRRFEANYFLIDSVVQEFAGSKLILDFEGSELPGVKHFYQNFGAVNQPYFSVKYNNLPWPLRLLK